MEIKGKGEWNKSESRNWFLLKIEERKMANKNWRNETRARKNKINNIKGGIGRRKISKD